MSSSSTSSVSHSSNHFNMTLSKFDEQKCCGISSKLLECPIDHAIYKQPMINEYGQTYERGQAEKLLLRRDRDPCTQKVVKYFVSNHPMFALIMEWKRRLLSEDQTSEPFQAFFSSFSHKLMERPCIDSHGHSFDESERTNVSAFCPLEDETTVLFSIRNFALQNALTAWTGWRIKKLQEHIPSSLNSSLLNEESSQLMIVGLYTMQQAFTTLSSSSSNSKLPDESEKLNEWLENTPVPDLQKLLFLIMENKQMTTESMYEWIHQNISSELAKGRLQDQLGALIYQTEVYEPLQASLKKLESDGETLKTNNETLTRVMTELRNDNHQLQEKTNQFKEQLEELEREAAYAKAAGIVLLSIAGGALITVGTGGIGLPFGAAVGAGGTAAAFGAVTSFTLDHTLKTQSGDTSIVRAISGFSSASDELIE